MVNLLSDLSNCIILSDCVCVCVCIHVCICACECVCVCVFLLSHGRYVPFGYESKMCPFSKVHVNKMSIKNRSHLKMIVHITAQDVLQKCLSLSTSSDISNPFIFVSGRSTQFPRFMHTTGLHLKHFCDINIHFHCIELKC